jgi:hypothetical protein
MKKLASCPKLEVVEKDLENATRFAFMGEPIAYTQLINYPNFTKVPFIIDYETFAMEYFKCPRLYQAVEKNGKIALVDTRITFGSIAESAEYINEKNLSPLGIVMEKEDDLDTYRKIGNESEFRKTWYSSHHIRLMDAIQCQNIFGVEMTLNDFFHDSGEKGKAEGIITLQTAQDSYIAGEKTEMDQYIKRIQKAIKDGYREVELIRYEKYLIRLSHAKQLLDAGYDIRIEKDGRKNYCTVASWTAGKRTGGVFTCVGFTTLELCKLGELEELLGGAPTPPGNPNYVS